MEGKSLVSRKKTLTADDRKALETLKRTTCHNGSRYEIGLPWKDDTKLPNNYFPAKAQLQSLENRLQQEPDLFCRYNQTIEADIENGFVEETQRQPSFMNSQLWYLPHHPVEHKMKKKVRRVTNAASVYKGHSLNKALLTGPDLLCSLVGLLLRFRQYKIAVTGDIEAMFMQVAIRTEDQDALRFLWNKDGEEKIFKYKRLIFSATCSPSCAIYILHRCAEDNKLSNPEAYSAIRNNFYMDDYLQSFKTTETAAITATEVKDTLQKGGFNLTKFFSNDPNTVMKITGENADTAIEQRILGQMWDAKEDIFIFKRPDLKLDVKSMQQRQLLSLAASLFDPLGIITPFSIRVRCILQSIVKQGNNWNNQIPREFQHDLQQWVDEYEQMPEISISRCLIPNPDAKHELHIFCDASSTTIATTIYIRSSSAEEITTQYVVSKARVSPIKTTTIPKLELEAAAMGAELASFVRSEMTAQFDKIQFWTDSMATLAIRRFVSRRGYPELIISDNGSNFTSAKKMLDLNKINVDNDYIKSQLQQQNITWKLNPPLAPHFGGIWERLIQSAKRTLLIILGSQKLKAEIFQTIVAETEGLLNSRPITYVSSDTNDEEALTPNHFLLRRPYSPLAPLTSTSRTFSKKEFSYTQTLLDHFWKRLQKEYTSDLISRPKWRTESEQLKEGDLVWLLHEFTPRGIWPMGRIAKCHNGLDGRARSFEIKTSAGVLNRPAVKLAKVLHNT
ncbi:uncharacterized protein LOC142345059 [Convolutriloba macropyga]|uniref:uncharacterized protein LOC142345059 n=1 Tax=Convolutriloba macropyga TaxID=536237 RepID=UPI003F51E3F5